MKSPLILARIMLLVATTPLLALGAMPIVTFRKLPPDGRPLDMVEVAQALKTGRIDSGWAMLRRHDARGVADRG